MGIHSAEGLSEWVSGFPQPRWGVHFGGRVQERPLNHAAHINARVTSLECAYVRVILQACEVGAHQEQEKQWTRSRWDVLDQVNLEEVCRTRFAVLQNCQFQLRGRFRQAARVALDSEQCSDGQDVLMETRGWKLFILLPFMLVSVPKWARTRCAEGSTSSWQESGLI